MSSDTEDPATGNNSSTASTTINPVPSGGVQTGAGGTARRPPFAPLAAIAALAILAGLLVIRRRSNA